jgi:DNA-binding GntR family transcriptional regulator
MVEANATFHSAVVALAGNARMNAAYAAIQLQIRLCMAMNLAVREEAGNADDVVDRHVVLLDLIESGDVPAILEGMSHHGDQSFMGRLVSG